MAKAKSGKPKKEFTFKSYQENVNAGSTQNRWSMTMSLLSGNLSKLILLNILILLFLLPTLALVLKRSISIQELALNYPFNQNTGLGYPFYPSVVGLAESVQMSANVYFYLAFLAFAVLGSFAISGGFYFMRNFIWSNGQFVTKDFFKGIKKNYLHILVVTILYSLILCLCVYSIGFSDYLYAVKGKWYFILTKISSIIIIAVCTVIYMYCCSFIVTYKSNVFSAIKNAFKITFSFTIPNFVMALFSLIPIILTLLSGDTSSGFGTIIIMFISFFGFVFILLAWSSYSQFVFDKTINGIVDKTEKMLPENRVSKFKKEEPTEKQFVKPINDNVTIEHLPEMFSRKDLQKLEESKQAMREDSDKYYNEQKEKDN